MSKIPLQIHDNVLFRKEDLKALPGDCEGMQKYLRETLKIFTPKPKYCTVEWTTDVLTAELKYISPSQVKQLEISTYTTLTVPNICLWAIDNCPSLWEYYPYKEI